MIFDSHAHYDDEAFDPDREALLSGMNQAGISHIVNVGASLEGVQATVELTEVIRFSTVQWASTRIMWEV